MRSPTAGEPAGDGAPRPPANRMAMAIFALIGALIAGYLLLYKLGIVGSIVCGSGGCERVQTSSWAVFLGVPVPLLGVVGYVAMLVLALVGVRPDLARSRAVALLLLLGAWAAAAFTLYLNGLEAFVIHAWCRWCIGSAVVVALLFLASLPELPRLRQR